MIKALWFIAKLSLLVTGLLWLAARPGTVEILWLGYELKASVGFLLAVLIIFLLLWTMAYRLFRAFISTPAALRRSRAQARHEKGYRTLTQGLVAIAAGDAQAAQQAANRAQLLVPDAPLSRLLTAQSALLGGNAPKARREFALLLEDDAAAFLGLRGLLNEAMQQKDYRAALTLMRRAEDLQPRRVWVLRRLFDLETRTGEWERALATLKKAKKYRALDAASAARHRQAILLAMAIESKDKSLWAPAKRLAAASFAINHSFTPAAETLANIYITLEKYRAAKRTLEKAWQAQPHPALAACWQKMTPPAKKAVSPYAGDRQGYDWMRRLTGDHPTHRAGKIALARAALDGKLWTEARTLLTDAGDFYLLAELERGENRNEEKALSWLAQAREKQNPESHWTCTACRQICRHWHARCPGCATFNQIEWLSTASENIAEGSFAQILDHFGDSDLLAPPAPEPLRK